MLSDRLTNQVFYTAFVNIYSYYVSSQWPRIRTKVSIGQTQHQQRRESSVNRVHEAAA